MARIKRALVIAGAVGAGVLALAAVAKAGTPTGAVVGVPTTAVVIEKVVVPEHTANFQPLNVVVTLFNPTNVPQPVVMDVTLSAMPWLREFSISDWAQVAGPFKAEVQPGRKEFTIPVIIGSGVLLAPLGPINVEITLRETGQKFMLENATEVEA